MPTLRRIVLLLLGFCAVAVHCTGRAVPKTAKRGVGDLLGGGSEPPAQAPPSAPQPQPAAHQQRPEQHLEEQPLQQHPGEQHSGETEAKAEQAGLLGKIVAGEQHTTTAISSGSSTATNTATTAHTTAKPTHVAEPTTPPAAPPPTPATSSTSATSTPTLLGDQATHKPGVDWHVAAIASIVVTAVGIAILAALFWDTWTRLAADVCCGRRRRAKKDKDGEELVPDWTRGSWGYSLKGAIGGGFPVFNTPPIGHNMAGTGSGMGGRAAFVAAEEVVGSPPLPPPPPRMPRMRSPAMPTRDWSYNPSVNAAGLGIGAPGLTRSRSTANRARSDSDGKALPNPHGEDPFATPKQEDYKAPGRAADEKEKNEDAYGGVI
ncbi:unnamed protein product [Peniophora sp. CBMAI 1063]|nr:unnamed protein product [Peniophora sp. CBMAI 1063]